jgi:hypothetical protein
MKIIFLSIFCLIINLELFSQDIPSPTSNSKSEYESYELSDTLLQIDIHPLRSYRLTQRSNTLVVHPESQDIAGTFGDPSRVLLRHVGVSTQNDQANGIIYRGLTSDNITWSIHGAEIVNPNHLSNAGTLSDQASASAGGVLAFPLETISQFQFAGQAYGSQLPNAIAGNSDLRFGSSNGNTFFKIGLLGIEAGYNSHTKRNVRAHARYSTVGLLSDFGVDFDGESINFQDLFLNFEIIKGLSYVGLIATSNNNKAAFSDTSLATRQEDLAEINYSSDIMIHGLTYEGTSAKVKHKHSLFYSRKYDTRESIIDNISESSLSSDNKLSYHGSLRFSDFHTGINATYFSGLREFSNSDFDDAYLTVQPFLSYSRIFESPNNSFYNLELSTSFYYDSYNQELTAEPYAQVQWSKNKNIIELNAGLKSQMLSPLIYGQKALSNDNINAELNRSKTAAMSLSWKWNSGAKFGFLSRIFYQYLYDLPTLEFSQSEFIYNPVFNGFSFTTFGSLDRNGDATTQGLELMIDYSLSEDFYINTNFSLINAKFDGFNGTNNFGHIYNLTITKEFNEHWLINIAGHFRGGTYENNPELPEVIQDQLNNYWRIDTRILYRWKAKNEIAIDIQNVSNRLNDAFYYFEPLTNQIEKETQLGTIPILSYKRIIN